jgi:hypothetical protein
MKKLSSVIKFSIELEKDNLKSDSTAPKKCFRKKSAQKKEISKRHIQLIDLAGDLVERPLDEAQSLCFMSRLLVMVNLPYRDPGKEARNWWKTNGDVSINVTPGYDEEKIIGIPYGSYPRLILAYLITQAVRTQSPEIFLGKTFREFLKLVGISIGGRQYKQVQKQLKRTISSSFSWTYKKEKVWSRTNIQVSHQSQLWWNPKSPDQLLLWEGKVKLNTDFFNEIIRKAVPLDFRVLKALKNSPLGLDLYMFLSWRVFKIKDPAFISWRGLHTQLGGQYGNIHEFSRDCRKHIKRIQAFWPELNVKVIKGRICIKPISKSSKSLISVDNSPF